MFRAYFRRQIKAQENRAGVSLEYLRHILRESLPSFKKLAKFRPLAENRAALPAAAFHMARLVAVRDEDSGACLQREVNAARQAGIPAAHIQAVLDNQPTTLPDDLATVYHFTLAVVMHTGAENDLRQQLRQTYGEAALVELALAIAACRVAPLTERALGYAVSCHDMQIHVSNGPSAS